MTQNDVMQLLIGKDIAASPTVSAGSPVVDYSSLADGECAVVNPHNIVLDASTVLTDDLVAQHGIKVVQRSGTRLINSDLIKQANILNYKGETGTAGVEQVSYIGYNGSENDIEVNNSTLYVTRLELKEKDINGFGQEIILNSPYKSDASATQEEIALGVVLGIHNVLWRQAVKPIRADLLNANAVDAADAFDNDATVTYGQKTFSVATNLEAGGAAAVVGDYVRFSNTPTVTGTALTDGIYRIESISGLNVTLDRHIQTPSGTYTASQATAEVILAAEAQATNFGIKLTGLARPFGLPKWRYSKVEFNVGLDDGFGETVVTYTTAMNLGRNTYESISELEWDLLGNEGDPYRGDFLWSAYKTDAVSTATYDCLNMNYYGDHPTQGVGATPRRQKQLMIAFATGFSNNEAPDIVIDVLDAYATISSGIGV
jgi:hypothetical protein